MAKRRNYMVQFNFPAERAAEFFKHFAPCLELTENFECTTVFENTPPEVPSDSQRLRSEEPRTAPTVYQVGPTMRTGPSLPNEGQGLTIEKTHTVRGNPVHGRPGNPSTAEAARERFKLAQRGLTPSAREILTTEFGGREVFLLREAQEALEKRGLSFRTAGPTLNNMKAKGLVEYLDTNKFRIKNDTANKNGAHGGL